MAPSRWQAIIWTNDGLVNWRIYASLGLDELIKTDLLLNNKDTNMMIFYENRSKAVAVVT